MRADPSNASSAVFAANRARGAVCLEVQLRDGLTRRGALHESGSLRVRFPLPEGDGLSAVLVNTAGGIAGGDRLSVEVTLGEGAHLTLTTAAAEKVYRARDDGAKLNISLKVADGARLAWLPHETILFDQARLSRRIDIDLSEGASLVLGEIVVFGRAAMGETMRRGSFVDRWRFRRGGSLVFAETIRLEGDVGAKLAQGAIAGGGVAVGTLLVVPGNEDLLARIREVSASFGGEVGLSAWNGFAMVRFCAQDAARLRADMVVVLGRASAVPLPRLWLN